MAVYILILMIAHVMLEKGCMIHGSNTNLRKADQRGLIDVSDVDEDGYSERFPLGPTRQKRNPPEEPSLSNDELDAFEDLEKLVERAERLAQSRNGVSTNYRTVDSFRGNDQVNVAGSRINSGPFSGSGNIHSSTTNHYDDDGNLVKVSRTVTDGKGRRLPDNNNSGAYSVNGDSTSVTNTFGGGSGKPTIIENSGDYHGDGFGSFNARGGQIRPAPTTGFAVERGGRKESINPGAVGKPPVIINNTGKFYGHGNGEVHDGDFVATKTSVTDPETGNVQTWQKVGVVPSNSALKPTLTSSDAAEISSEHEQGAVDELIDQEAIFQIIYDMVERELRGTKFARTGFGSVDSFQGVNQNFQGATINAGSGTTGSFNNHGSGKQSFGNFRYNGGGSSGVFNNHGDGDQDFSGQTINVGDHAGDRQSFENVRYNGGGFDVFKNHGNGFQGISGQTINVGEHAGDGQSFTIENSGSHTGNGMGSVINGKVTRGPGTNVRINNQGGRFYGHGNGAVIDGDVSVRTDNVYNPFTDRMESRGSFQVTPRVSAPSPPPPPQVTLPNPSYWNSFSFWPFGK